MRGLDRILELQALDSTIDRLQQRRAQLEGGQELAAARDELEEAEGRLGELRLALDAVDAEQSRLEREIDSMQRKAEADRTRMYDGSIANQKELEALQHEITSLQQRISNAEDQVLDQMERHEGLEGRIGDADPEVTQARARVETLGGDAVRELETIETALSETRAAREALGSELDEELLALYEELRLQKKGIAAAALVDGVCQACHEKLSALELDRLKHSEGIRRCEYCRRIVVFA